MSVLKHGLSTMQIWSYLQNEEGFLGCFPSNNIPPIRTYPSSIIINTSRSGEVGEHWVGLHLTNDASFYFDSFGIPIIEEDIFQFLKKYYNVVIYNQVCIQDLTSKSCGLYSIAFIKMFFL